MKKELRDQLLDKYYRGETTLEEEIQLKSEVLLGDAGVKEKEIFGFYRGESMIPKDLESRIFEKMMTPKPKIIKTKWFRTASVAATIAIILSVYFGYRNMRNAEIENEIMLMDQAFYHVSQTIQPVEQEEMFILWVDDELEVIIN